MPKRKFGQIQEGSLPELKISRPKLRTVLKWFILIVILVLIGVFLYYLISEPDNVEPITSNIDGRSYNVRSNGEGGLKQQSANFLANISKKVDILVDYMKRNQKPNREIADRLYSRWSRCHFRETGSHEKSAAYTINKGEEMRLCVRDGNKLENSNTGMFVILHELAHLMSVTYGHNEEFKDNFFYIVHLASELGIYKPENFSSKPVSYCGTEINSTPCDSGTCSTIGG